MSNRRRAAAMVLAVRLEVSSQTVKKEKGTMQQPRRVQPTCMPR